MIETFALITRGQGGYTHERTSGHLYAVNVGPRETIRPASEKTLSPAHHEGLQVKCRITELDEGSGRPGERLLDTLSCLPSAYIFPVFLHAPQLRRCGGCRARSFSSA